MSTWNRNPGPQEATWKRRKANAVVRKRSRQQVLGMADRRKDMTLEQRHEAMRQARTMSTPAPPRQLEAERILNQRQEASEEDKKLYLGQLDSEMKPRLNPTRAGNNRSLAARQRRIEKGIQKREEREQ